MEDSNKNILYLNNMVQVNLWHNELQGQISDGCWENSTPNNHWRFWSYAEARVGEELKVVQKTYKGRYLKNNYGFTRKDLLDIIGDRMIAVSKLSLIFPEILLNDYSSHVSEMILEGTIKQVSQLELLRDYQKEYLQKANIQITQEVLDKFWLLKYGIKELKKDLNDIKIAIKNLKN